MLPDKLKRIEGLEEVYGIQFQNGMREKLSAEDRILCIIFEQARLLALLQFRVFGPPRLPEQKEAQKDGILVTKDMPTSRR